MRFVCVVSGGWEAVAGGYQSCSKNKPFEKKIQLISSGKALHFSGKPNDSPKTFLTKKIVKFKKGTI